ncbi:MAG: type II toxin-antitoxin system death-on-curing family toxin [Aridibacter sp.]
MATDEIIYLTFDEAVWFHFDLMMDWNEIRYGLEFRHLLDSALARPQNEVAYANADIIRQAASLCFGLIKNHPWTGGNKRTATHLMETFLKLNGYELNCKIIEIIEMCLAVEADEWKVDEIESWLRSKITFIEKTK